MRRSRCMHILKRGYYKSPQAQLKKAVRQTWMDCGRKGYRIWSFEDLVVICLVGKSKDGVGSLTEYNSTLNVIDLISNFSPSSNEC